MKGLLKATLQSGAASAGNLLAAMASAKIYAVVLGPKYNAVAGVINNLVAFCVALATAAGTAAFLQGASSRSGGERWRFIKTVARFYFLGGLLLSIAVLLAAPFMASQMFSELADGAAVLRGCAPVILTGVLTGVGTGLLQVEGQIGVLARITLGAALISVGLAAVAAPLISQSGFWLVPMVQLGNQLIMLVMLGIVMVKQGWMTQWRLAGPGVPIASLHGYWALTASSLLSALVFYGSQVQVRTQVNGRFGLLEGGAFAAAWALCGMYVDLLLRSFSQVYLPRLSAEGTAGRQALVDQFFRFAVMFGLPLVLLVGVFRHLVLHILFDSTYAEAGNYVTWMLPGDLLKMFSWLYGMVLIGAGDARRSMMSDLTWCAGFLVISVATVASGFRFGPCLAFSVMYAVSLVINVAVSRRHGVRLPAQKALFIVALTGLTALVAWVSA